MSMGKEEVLGRSPLFEQLSRAELGLLAELSTPRRFTAGELLMRQGEVGDSLHVLAEGEVEVLHAGGSPRPIAVLGPPATVGEMALVDRQQRSATVLARTEVRTLQLSAEHLTAFRRHSRDGFTFLVINLARILSSRLRETSAQLASRL